MIDQPFEWTAPGIVYKLTDVNMQTYGGYQWALGERRTFPGTGPLCGPGWCHVYSHPVVAEWLNPIHADFGDDRRLFRGETSGSPMQTDGPLKAGVADLVLLSECDRPALTPLDRVVLAIFAVRAIPKRRPIPAWDDWAVAIVQRRQREPEAAAWEAAEAEAEAGAARAAAGAAWAAAASSRPFLFLPLVAQWEAWKAESEAAS